MARGKVVLAYSGGLDTSVAIRWLQEKYDLDVITVIVNLGQAENLLHVQRKALHIGAIESLVVDMELEFVNDFVRPAIQANALYEKKYPLATALARPAIAKAIVDVARKTGAKAVAHGCTGKGNDQVRFDVSLAALAPDVEVIAPQREWAMSREEEIEYAKAHNIEVPVTESSPYSIDENIWGRSIEAGLLEDPWLEAPPDAFRWTKDPVDAPDRPEYLELTFDKGMPVVLDEERVSLLEVIGELNERAGRHGVGRVDLIENRLVGIKSREVYECPGATVLLTAHRELEALTLPRELVHYKYGVEEAFAEQVYYGLWYSPLREALQVFVEKTQDAVSGTVRVKLYKGHCQVVGRKSDYSLYDYGLATYDETDTFSHESAKGFIELWGLPSKVWARKHRKG